MLAASPPPPGGDPPRKPEHDKDDVMDDGDLDLLTNILRHLATCSEFQRFRFFQHYPELAKMLKKQQATIFALKRKPKKTSKKFRRDIPKVPSTEVSFASFYAYMKSTVEDLSHLQGAVLPISMTEQDLIFPENPSVEIAVEHMNRIRAVAENARSHAFQQAVMLGIALGKLHEVWNERLQRSITWSDLIKQLRYSSLGYARHLELLGRVCQVYPRLRFVQCAPTTVLRFLPDFQDLMRTDVGQRNFWMRLGAPTLQFSYRFGMPAQGADPAASAPSSLPISVTSSVEGPEFDIARRLLTRSFTSPPAHVAEGIARESDQQKEDERKIAELDALCEMGNLGSRNEQIEQEEQDDDGSQAEELPAGEEPGDEADEAAAMVERMALQGAEEKVQKKGRGRSKKK